MAGSYENALKILESRQRRSRPTKSTTEGTPSSSGTPSLRGTPSIEGMAEWLHMLGYTQADLKRLNIIHVAGTKGKGSTCAFTESLLRTHGTRSGWPRKTGLYTSPHLIRPEERIRINSQPLEPEAFAKYLSEVVDKIPQLLQPYEPTAPSIVERGPRYLQLLCLLAIHVFLRENVDLAIIETHSGGEYDATNVIQTPVVTAVTTLGIDHIAMLGPTVREIAWHKGGIFKRGAEALTTAQEEEGTEEVLVQRAAEKAAQLQVVAQEDPALKGLPQLQPGVQRKNASLAIAASNAWLRIKGDQAAALTPADIRGGLTSFDWPGRFQTLPGGQLTWFLDAAHNTLSVRIAGQWFLERSKSLQGQQKGKGMVTRVLIFTHLNELRDSEELLRALTVALRDAGTEVDHVIFTTPSGRQGEEVRVPFRAWRKIWEDVFPSSEGETVHETSSIAAAVQRARELGQRAEGEGKEAHVLVTGSQHLVGPVLELLERGSRAT